MAQYKASMGRMLHQTQHESDGSETSTDRSDPHTESTKRGSHLILAWLETHAAFIMMPTIPLLWCILLISTMDRPMVLSAYGMPLLGVGSASLANAVPVGGGIVFVPILSLWGVQLRLGTAFAVATMTFGNGVFGFLTWLRKDPDSIAWHAVSWAVFPAWAGAAWGVFHPFLTPDQCRHLFAAFCIVVAAIVGRGIYVGRRSDGAGSRPFSVLDDNNDSNIDNPSQFLSKGRATGQQQLLASCFSFSAGLILVAHIGIGNAMTTFLVGVFVWQLPAKPAVVTGIIVGGWTSVLPFALHLLILRDVPVGLWVMGLPGVYIGARIAPIVHESLGITNVLTVFAGFLVVTAVLMMST